MDDVYRSKVHDQFTDRLDNLRTAIIDYYVNRNEQTFEALLRNVTNVRRYAVASQHILSNKANEPTSQSDGASND